MSGNQRIYSYLKKNQTDPRTGKPSPDPSKGDDAVLNIPLPVRNFVNKNDRAIDELLIR